MFLLVNGGPGSFVFMPGRGKDGVDPGGQTSGIIPRFETRLDFILGDLFAKRIGQDAFQAVADLHKHLAILNENKQNDAVIPGLLPNPPGTRHADGVIIDGRIGLHLRINRNTNLVAGCALEVFQQAVELVRRGGVHDVRVIIKVMVRRRRNDFGGNGGETPNPNQDETATAHGGHGLAGAGAGFVLSKLNCTFGGVSDPAVAEK